MSEPKTLYRVSLPQSTISQIEKLAGQEAMRPGDFLAQLMRRCDAVGTARPGMLLAELTTLAAGGPPTLAPTSPKTPTPQKPLHPAHTRAWKYPRFVIVNGKVFGRFVARDANMDLPDEDYYQRFGRGPGMAENVYHRSDVLTPLERDMLTSGEFEDATVLSPDGFTRAVEASDRKDEQEQRQRDMDVPPPRYFENRGVSDAGREWAIATNPNAPIVRNVNGRLVDEAGALFDLDD